MHYKHRRPDVRRGLLILLTFETLKTSVCIQMQAQCLPVDLRGDRRTIKLVKERKRKLFHSQVYESEIGMKKLYIQVNTNHKSYEITHEFVFYTCKYGSFSGHSGQNSRHTKPVFSIYETIFSGLTHNVYMHKRILYFQTAKKLAAFGCKVFQVKELLHGRTLRKVSLGGNSSALLCLYL